VICRSFNDSGWVAAVAPPITELVMAPVTAD